ncbi:sulfite exporter TauE/SafE family protein [Phreatobacter stygius]|uniref:Probable membrane transporter protein n=1 Tax=Phreatobacter stygius TaxID=1940610 RepID=A0A4D7B6Q0_9HYPH|nr:sulfite exporter TauE/SafE family protein [Phreatobacter stygius]QCI63647.1 sulfite exporter TauE/SafE family protein [Phreatobacter stygius]
MDFLARLGDSPPLLVLVAALVAGTVRGYTGFGSAMIFMPVAGAYLGPKTAIGIMWIIDGTLQLAMVRSTWKHARWSEIGPLFMGYVVGLPLGVYVLMTFDPGPIRWVTSISIVVALAMLLTAKRVETSPGLPATVATGAASGLISGIASLGGMVLSLFWLAGPSRNEAVRGSSVAFFVPASLLSGALLAIAGIFNLEVLRIAAWAILPYGVGIGLGSLLFSHADARLFRPVAFAVIAAAALTSLPVLDAWLR